MTKHKKKRSSSGMSKNMLALTAAVLIAFISGLYFIFIENNKSENKVIVPNNGKNTDNWLPPKPKERWHYIKELEKYQVGVQSTTETTVSREKNSPLQLTNEQRQLLEQIQVDMRQKHTHLKDVPYNDQNKTTSSAQTSTTTHDAPNNYFNQQHAQIQRQVAQTIIEPKLMQSTRQTTLLRRETPTLAPIQPVQKSNEADTAKKKHQLWLVKCGSFKTMDQAESVRAQLAFVGIESYITTGGIWNRVLLGPYSSRAGADKILQNVRETGISNCIPIVAGG